MLTQIIPRTINIYHNRYQINPLGIHLHSSFADHQYNYTSYTATLVANAFKNTLQTYWKSTWYNLTNTLKYYEKRCSSKASKSHTPFKYELRNHTKQNGSAKITKIISQWIYNCEIAWTFKIKEISDDTENKRTK